MIRTTCGVLEEAFHAQLNNICLLDLPESFYEDLLHRQGNAHDYTQRLPSEFHEFIDMA
jgi:hypothetical protein